MTAPTRPPRTWFVQYGLEEFIPLIDDLLIRINSGGVWAEQCRRLTGGVNPLVDLALQRDVMETLAEYERLYKSIGECLEWLQRDARSVLEGAQPAAGAMQQILDSLVEHGLPHPESMIVEIEREYQRRRQHSQFRRGPQPAARASRRVVSSKPDNIPIRERQLVVELRGVGRSSPDRGGRPGFQAEDLSPQQIEERLAAISAAERSAAPPTVSQRSSDAPPRAQSETASSSQKKPSASGDAVRPKAKGDPVESRFAMLDVDWEEEPKS